MGSSINENVDKSIEQLKLEASEAAMFGKYLDSIRIYTSIISLAQNASHDELSKLYSKRATCYLSAKQFEFALKDSNTAISLDAQNIYGYTQKCKALIQLKQGEKARETINIGKSILGEQEAWDECEELMDQSWMSLKHSGKKLLTAISLSFIIGVLVNALSTKSGLIIWAIVGVASLILVFLNYRKLWQLMTGIFYEHYHKIFHDQTTNSTNNAVKSALSCCILII